MRGLIFIVLLVAAPALAQIDPPDMVLPQKHRLGIVRDNLTNVPQTMIPALPVRTVTYCTLVGGAAAETVTFRPIGGGTPQVNIAVPAGGLVGRTFNFPVPIEGFEVLTTNPAGDVKVQCLFILGPQS